MIMKLLMTAVISSTVFLLLIGCCHVEATTGNSSAHANCSDAKNETICDTIGLQLCVCKNGTKCETIGPRCCDWYKGVCTQACPVHRNVTECDAGQCTWLQFSKIELGPGESVPLVELCGARCDRAQSETTCEKMGTCDWYEGACKNICEAQKEEECSVGQCTKFGKSCAKNCGRASTDVECNKIDSCDWYNGVCKLNCIGLAENECNGSGQQCTWFWYGSCVKRCGRVTAEEDCQKIGAECDWHNGECKQECLVHKKEDECPGGQCSWAMNVKTCRKGCARITNVTECHLSSGSLCDWYDGSCGGMCGAANTKEACPAGKCAWNGHVCKPSCARGQNEKGCSELPADGKCRWISGVCAENCRSELAEEKCKAREECVWEEDDYGESCNGKRV